MVATNKGSLAAAGTADPANWVMGTVVPLIRDHFKANGQPTTPDRNVYTMRLAMTDLLVKELGLKGSGPRVLAVLTHPRVRILIKVDNGNKGKDSYPPLWSVNMSAQPTRATVREAMTGIADATTQRRREQRAAQLRRENRLAGDIPTTTTGGPISVSRAGHNHGPEHNHAGSLDHEHEGRRGLHVHLSKPGDTFTILQWVDDVNDQARVEYRTRAAHTDHSPQGAISVQDLQPDPQPASTGTHREIRSDLAGGRPAMVVGPERDPRYRGLLEIIGDLEADKLRLIRRAEAAEEDARDWKQRAEAAEAKLDPSTAEADEVLARYGKK